MNEDNLKNEIITIDDRIQSITVNSPETYRETGQIMISLNDLIKKIKEYWSDPKEKAHQAHKEICSKESEMLRPLEERKKILSQKISIYLTDQEHIKQAEQQRLDTERKEQEEKERQKLLKKAEAQEKKGNIEKADSFKEIADNIYIPPVIVQGAVEKTTRMDEGTASVIKDIEVKIIDVFSIIRMVADQTIPLSIININESKLKAYIKALGLKELKGCLITAVSKAKFRSSF